MAVGLFVVRATIAKERESEFNRWYNEEHLPQVLRYNGAVSGRRYRRIAGEDRYDYMAVYEFASEAVLQTFLQSDALKDLRAEYDRHFGAVSERVEQLRGVVSVVHDEPAARLGELGGHVRRVPPRQVDVPAGREHSLGRGASDLAGAAEDQGSRHRGERTGGIRSRAIGC